MTSLVLAAVSAVFLLPCEYHIDFSGWHGAAMVEFDVRVTSKEGTIYETTIQLAPGATVIQARDLLWFALKRDGWRGHTVGKGILVLEGSKKSAIRSVEFTSKNWKPDVRWMPLPPEKK